MGAATDTGELVFMENATHSNRSHDNNTSIDTREKNTAVTTHCCDNDKLVPPVQGLIQ